MRFPKGYAGVKKLFASEILNIISTLLFFVTSIITIIFSKKISNPNYLPFVVIPMMAVGLTALIAFIMQLVGLNQARKERAMLTVFLMNGFQMRGVVTGFDSFVILLQSDGRQQMIYKHAVSTLTPSVPIRLTQE